MHQVKLFKGIESEIQEVENEVNEWLRTSGAKVVNIFGNVAPQTPRPDQRGSIGGTFSPSDIFMAVVFEAD